MIRIYHHHLAFFAAALASRTLAEAASFSTPVSRSVAFTTVGRIVNKSSSVAASTGRNFKTSTIPHKMTSISISEAFDGGNGQLRKTDVVDGQTTVFVDIRKDPYTELEKKHHFQYFSFRSTVGSVSESTTVKYVLSNAGDASYPSAWDGSTAFVSTNPSDPLSWTRKLDTSFDSKTGELSWSHTHSKNESVYFAYFPPYSYERHLSLISQVSASDDDNVTVESLGQTLDGREMECVKIGTGDRVCWIIHRQHPGETMAEFFAEGLLNRLLGTQTAGSLDGMAKKARSMYTFYIVPNMCPDGAFRGHLRTNAGGQNLNREWAPDTSNGDDVYDAPTLKRSPEVYHVLKKMDETGCDAFLDVHGDEELPFNFLAGGEGCPTWSDRLRTLHGAFLAKYSMANSDMQIPVGYEPEPPLKGRMNICSNQIGTRFDCFSATLEMPFKDCASNPDPLRGWNPSRAMQLGASVLDPLVEVHPNLRSTEEFWRSFTKDLDYVMPTSDYKSLEK